MKKVFSIALIILLLLSVGAISAGALAANTTIYLNTNGAAGWNNAYIYGWSGEFSGTFIQMEETPHAGIYSYTFTQATQDGMEHFLFTNKNTWSNQEQTVPLATQAGKNVYRLQEKTHTGNGQAPGIIFHLQRRQLRLLYLQHSRRRFIIIWMLHCLQTALPPDTGSVREAM